MAEACGCVLDSVMVLAVLVMLVVLGNDGVGEHSRQTQRVWAMDGHAGIRTGLP